ncbi:MAG: hypothetical protein WDA41_07365 [Candidatus Neomarinimicrobiota bacterium]
MAFSITAWNINPNRVWFVRLSDAGSNIGVELYLTQADAEAQTNRQASGSTTGFGSDIEVILTPDLGATVPAVFYLDYTWHLKVSGSDGDETKIFKVKEFVDLDEISHPIYRNTDLITTRATAEIDAHTHAVIRKEVTLGSHIPDIEPGDIVTINSTRRGKDELLQVTEHRIAAEISEETSLTSTLSIAGYLALKR